jgi:RNA polymerase sigma-70 factor (ECF subfamily)
MLADLSDELLMLRYREDDPLAFRELYRRHSRGLYQFLAWQSPRREWVDEVMQDTWSNLHQARARYEPQAAFRTFLFQIARNRLVDVIRQQGRVVLASDMRAADGDAPSAYDALLEVGHDSVAPDEALDGKRATARLHRALRELPDEQREALVLQQFNGMALEEIAQLTGVPAETVKSRLRYAMRKLRQELTPDPVEGAPA